MNQSLLISVLFVAISLSACDKPAVVVVPAPPAVAQAPVPGPAGPAGEAGAPGATGDIGLQGDTGNTGNTGEAGKDGEGTTVIVTPPAAPEN